MLTYPVIDPVIVSLGPLKVHWYGVMYLLGFLGGYALLYQRSQRADSPVKPVEVEDLILYTAFGVVIGGRLGYVFFYGFDQLLREPLWLFKIWTGGMSFHGGLLGVLVAMGLYARKLQCRYFEITDFLAPAVPIGLGLGRLGNFINQELWGRPSEVSWAMIFPNDPLSVPRHPSQLYQFALEGVALLLLLLWFSRRPRPVRSVSGLFLLGYGVFRFSAEFFREPDNHIGFDSFGWMTRGQELCVPMILAGIALLVVAYRRPTAALQPAQPIDASGETQEQSAHQQTDTAAENPTPEVTVQAEPDVVPKPKATRTSSKKSSVVTTAADDNVATAKTPAAKKKPAAANSKTATTGKTAGKTTTKTSASKTDAKPASKKVTAKQPAAKATHGEEKQKS